MAGLTLINRTSLSNYGSDKVSSATQTKVNVVTHRGGDARNWHFLPWHSGRAEIWRGGKRLRAVKSKVCCSCYWEEGEDSKRAAVAAGKGHLLQAPQLLHQSSSGRDGSPKVWHALSRRQGQESSSSKTALPRTTTVVQFNIQTRCMSLPRNTSCPWFLLTNRTRASTTCWRIPISPFAHSHTGCLKFLLISHDDIPVLSHGTEHLLKSTILLHVHHVPSGQLWRPTLSSSAQAWLHPSWPQQAKRRVSLTYYKLHSHRVRLSFGSKPSVWSLLHHPQGTGRIKYHPFPAHVAELGEIWQSCGQNILLFPHSSSTPLAGTLWEKWNPWSFFLPFFTVSLLISAPSLLPLTSGGSEEPEAPMLGGSLARPRAAVLWLVQFSTYCGDDSVAVNSPQSVSFPFLNTIIPFPRPDQ